jgi:2-dehydro-3-deoxyphosphogluconate aldolase/(4S)-4-hydroxy-2-oxoglutarate aldolase
MTARAMSDGHPEGGFCIMSEESTRIERTLAAVLEEGVILCVRFSDGSRVVEACRAAVSGGLRVLELTLTTPGVLEAMRTLARDETILAGGGTVLTPDDARHVAAAGGRFALSPVFDPEVVDEAHRLGLLAIPGTATPGEILAAHRHGARLVKIFPAGALGGPAFLRAVRGPLPDVPLVPTNGPTAETLGEYLAAGAVAVGVGGEVFPEGYTLDGVRRAAGRVRAAVQAYRSGRGAGSTPGAPHPRGRVS